MGRPDACHPIDQAMEGYTASAEVLRVKHNHSGFSLLP